LERENKNKDKDWCSIPNLKKEFDLDEITNFQKISENYSGTGRDKDGKNFRFSGTCDGKEKSKTEDHSKNLIDSL